MKSKPLEVVGAVIRGEVGGEPAVLAFRRSRYKAAGGLWEFPGGKVEHEEPAVVALRRELEEELSVRAEVREVVSRSMTRVGSRVIDLTCYDVTLNEIPSVSTDHDAIRWVLLSELDSIEWAAPDIPAVRKLMGRL